MKYKFIRICWFHESIQRFIDFDDEFVSVVMIKSILEDYLIYGWVLAVECYKEHIVLVVVVYSKRLLLPLQPYLEQFEFSTLLTQTQQINSFRQRKTAPVIFFRIFQS